jgi:integrase
MSSAPGWPRPKHHTPRTPAATPASAGTGPRPTYLQGARTLPRLGRASLVEQDQATQWGDSPRCISAQSEAILSPYTFPRAARPFSRGRRRRHGKWLHDSLVMRQRPLGPQSIEHIMATLRLLLTYAEVRELVTSNAVVNWKRTRRLGRRRSSPAYRVAPENVLDSSELVQLLDRAASDFPGHFPLLIFLADTGSRLGEASALRWIDVDLERRTARIQRSFSNGKYLAETKSGRERVVELSSRLVAELAARRPEVFGAETLVFAASDGGLLDPHNFRARVFGPLVRRVLGAHRRFTPHGLRHTFATLHLSNGTPIKWIQAQGGWASAKLLLDWYGHFLPSEQHGFADALTTALDGASPQFRRGREFTPAENCSTDAGLRGAPGRIRTCDFQAGL